MTQDSSPAPGAARAAGPTIADTFAGDRIPPPAPLAEQRYEFLGDADIPTARYTSPEFFDREMEDMWARAWQWACREEHIPDEGDTYVYDIGPYSVIVVRTGEGEVQAFRNSCTHRGTRLLGAEGTGYMPAFTCPFHGWSWELDGSIRNIQHDPSSESHPALIKAAIEALEAWEYEPFDSDRPLVMAQTFRFVGKSERNRADDICFSRIKDVCGRGLEPADRITVNTDLAGEG